MFSENGDREGKLSFVERSVASGEGIGGVCRLVDGLGGADFRDGLCNNAEDFADPIKRMQLQCHVVSQSIGIILCLYLGFALQTWI